MSLDELRQFSDQIEQDVFAVLTLEGSVRAAVFVAKPCWRLAKPQGEASPSFVGTPAPTVGAGVPTKGSTAGSALTAANHLHEGRHRCLLVCHDRAMCGFSPISWSNALACGKSASRSTFSTFLTTA
uniref:Uncharacterized protein n=1 Tax=Ditylenchus dipsaci TaxID=166011 RepID=A0A915DUB6_9BILA